jgi:hypothetical protein
LVKVVKDYQVYERGVWAVHTEGFLLHIEKLIQTNNAVAVFGTRYSHLEDNTFKKGEYGQTPLHDLLHTAICRLDKGRCTVLLENK